MSEERKSLYDISWKVTEEEYRKSPALSYSTIARFHRDGFDGLDKLFDKIESPSLIFGSMVDVLITGGQEEFDSLFVVAEFPSLPDSQINVIKYLFERNSENYNKLSDIPDNLIIAATEVLEFQRNWKPETRSKVIKENGVEYYNLLYISIGKTLISTKDYQDAQECVNALKTHSFTAEFFEPDNPFDKTIEKFYQLKFQGEYENIKLRCMADLIIVNHENKTIRPIDLKTSFKKEWNFPSSFIQWCYWIQAQLYWYIIRQNLDNNDIYKDYELLDYQFIVISNNSKIPLVWEYPDTKAVVNCYYSGNGGIECKNWREIVKELNYYLTIKPILPIGIGRINNIIKWLKHE